MTAKRLILLVILVPIAVILVAFIVANRSNVVLSLDPLSRGGEIITYSAPFFVWLFLFLAFGMLIGGASVWLGQRRYRKGLREKQAEVEKLKKDLAKITELTSSLAPK